MTTPLSEYKQASADIWRFFQAHMPPHDTDEFWDEAVKTADALYEKYRDSGVEHYTRKYIVLILDELGRMQKHDRQRDI